MILIIAILAAVSLPQYQKAVWKSHTIEAQLNLNKLIEALYLYKLANGTAPASSGQYHGLANKEILEGTLDLSFPDEVWKNLIITFYNDDMNGIGYMIRYPDYSSPWTALYATFDGPYAQKIRCYGTNTAGENFCKSLCGELGSKYNGFNACTISSFTWF